MVVGLVAWVEAHAEAPAELCHGGSAIASADAARIGRVLTTMDAGGFTYAELDLPDADASTLWIAGPLTALTPGATVATTEGVLMADFTSRTLGRTFHRIWFVAGLRVMGPASDPVAAVPVVAPVDGGLTVAEALAPERAGSVVVVAGAVTRRTDGVLGRSWLHLRDGSSNSATGAGDLAVTVDPSAPGRPGDIVVVKGTLTAGRDFGSGYVYAVLLEAESVDVRTPSGGGQ